MQNTAISLALCLEDKYHQFNFLLKELEDNFNIEIHQNVSLFTVRNVKMQSIERFYKGKTVLLEQIAKQTLQMITLP